MKKFTILALSLFAFSFVSCTDQYSEDEEINQTEFATGHGEVGDPDNGSDDEEEVGG